MRKIILLSLLILTFCIPGSGFSYSFQDDFDDGDFGGWTEKNGVWSVGGTVDKYLCNTNDPYGVLWKDDSLGVYQKIQVDAYFNVDNGANINDQIAHLRLRINGNGSPNQFWDTGYMAEFQLNKVTIYNAYLGGGHEITSYSLGSSPISSSGWYTLVFAVGGTGADTHFEAWINGEQYIDNIYNNSIAALDSGYVDLGRLIRYDNAQGYSSNTPVPEPITMILLSFGLFGLAGYRKITR